MTVEQLMRLLSEYPPHWRIVIATHRDQAPPVEISAMQDSRREAPGGNSPIVVISS